ncbi:hypothetical protein NQ317_010747 [Molorchus minor]|uniref:Mpv17-like protein 2 n=1 Tax=Molorchus minor TaxID=1323400 RepID=A0ABQ9JGP5_9CUCU|nr:hypothetical protein NQ317_010747 [Molorchus minor]
MFRIRNCISTLKRHLFTSKMNKAPIRSGITLAFGKYLLVTNTVSSGALMLIGDIIQQEIEYRQKKLLERYDYGRLSRMFLVGLGLGPLHHYFYVWLAKVMPDRTMSTIMKKLLIDQFIMSPLCIAAFFYSIGALEMKPMKKCTEELKEKCIEVYVVCALFLCKAKLKQIWTGVYGPHHSL